MGLLRNFLEGLREKEKEREEMDDEKTTDKYLRSLRRQRRTQMESVEKLELKKKIKDFERIRTRDVVVGKMVDDDDVFIKKKIKKKIEILKAKQFMIPKKRPQKSFLSKGNI